MRTQKKLADILIVMGIVTLLLGGASFVYERQGSAVHYVYPDDVPRPLAQLSPIPTRPLSSAPLSALPTATSTPAATATLTSLPEKGATLAQGTPTPPATATPAVPTLTSTSTPTVLPSATFTPTQVEPSATPTPPRLVIPKIDVSAGIVEVAWRVVETSDGLIAVWDTTEQGVGHHIDSAQPGERGNVVISGHGRENGSFARLAELAPGDEIQVYTVEGGVYRYLVSESVKVAEVGLPLGQRQDNARYMEPTADARLTLITCWPAWAYTHRLIVIARLAGS